MSGSDVLRGKIRASQHPNVTRVGMLFDGLGFEPLLVSEKIRDNSGYEVGDIDLAFGLEDHVFLIEVSKQRKERNEKIRASFEKWSEPSNTERVGRTIGLTDASGFFRIYVDTSRTSSTDGVAEISSQFRNPGQQNFILFEDDVKYFENMKDKTGRFAKYDFLSFIEAKPRQRERPINAIRYHVSGKEVFSFIIDAKSLLEVAYVFRRRGKDVGYQRALNYDRVEEIKEKIRTQQIIAFPNSILINILRPAASDPPSNPAEPPTPCVVRLPEEYCSSRVVDGQHRLLGIARLPDTLIRPINLPVLAFNQLEQVEEIKTFVEINNNQSRVDRNLVLDLSADFEWPVDSLENAQKGAVHVARRLSEKGVTRIYFGGATEEREGRIYLATFVKALVGNNLAGWADSLWGSESYTRSKELFEKIKSDTRLSSTWRDYLLSNKGVRVFFRAIYLLEKNRRAGRINLTNVGLVTGLAGVADAGLFSEVEQLYGEGGVTFGVRAIYERLKTEHPDTFRRFTLDLRALRSVSNDV